VFSKFDMCDAYKCVPVKVSEFQLQGFLLLHGFFFEKKQVFGAKSAVPNYDRFGNTVKSVAQSFKTSAKQIQFTVPR
jgi:hypothetical protein